ncbi:MAG TPA: response regulator [Ktedonobacterales bacterium]|jgi:CheY-like chemotaxis protein
MSKVLVIDDDPALCQLLTMLLTEEGFHVKAARNGREGLGILQQEGGWLILLDLMMPYMDGNAVLQVLREDQALLDSNIVVLMSAGNMAQDPQPLQEPVQAILPKPFDLESVLTLVNQLTSQAV